MITTSVTDASRSRVAISFDSDDSQTIFFISKIEFLELMNKMFDYRDSHKDELIEIVRLMKQQKS